MRSHGRASVSSRNPRAFGICDRCGFLYNHVRLQWQFDYRGAALLNTRVLVCDTCLDVPQNQLRNIVIPADPTPILNARVQDYATASTNIRTTSSQVLRITNATGDSETATLTLQVPTSVAAIAVGSMIVVAGVEPIGYNGTYVVTGSTNDPEYTVSFASLQMGSLGVAGTVTTNIDAKTGLPLPVGDTRITQNNDVRVTQSTGEPPFGLNETPGVEPDLPASIGGDDPGLPYNFTEIPETGPL